MPTARISENRTTMLTVRPIAAEHGHGEQERDRDGEADQQRGAQAQHRHGDDHGQRDGGQHVVAEIVQHGADVVGLVLEVADLDAWPASARARPRPRARTCSMVSMMLRPIRFLTSSASAGRPSTRAKPSGSLKVRRTSATSPSVTTRSPADLDRHAQHVLEVLDQARHLDREPALADVPGAGGDQLVVALDQAQDRLELAGRRPRSARDR